MTVSSTNAVSGPYVANGATTVFPFTFKAMTAGEIRVTIVEDETETEQSETLYTVTLSTGGGNVTFADAPASGDVYIYSEPAFRLASNTPPRLSMKRSIGPPSGTSTCAGLCRQRWMPLTLALLGISGLIWCPSIQVRAPAFPASPTLPPIQRAR